MSKGYIAGIDGIRALAILSVMLFHIDPALLPGGFIGVDIFFVISGYVISLSLSDKTTQPLSTFLFDFYKRRMLRIVAALLFFLLLMSLLSTLFIPSAWLSNANNQTALAAFLAYSNYALIWYSDGYFSPAAEYNPFLHTWSIAIEEQFYLLFPLLLFACYRTKHRLIVPLLVWSLTLLSLLIAAHQTTAQPEHAYYLLPSRFWEFMSGFLLYRAHEYRRLIPKSDPQSAAYLFLGLLLLLWPLMAADKAHFPFPWALPAVIATALLLSATRRESRYLVPLTNPLATYVGKISYSLYLWHWGVYALMRWTVGFESALQIFVGLLSVTLLAIFSYRFIEQPIRTAAWLRRQKSLYIIVGALSAILLSYLLAAALFSHQPRLSLSRTADAHIWYPTPKDTSAIQAQNDPLLQGKTLFVVGDSHTGAYSTMLYDLSARYGIRVQQHFTGGCPVLDLASAPKEECRVQTHALLQKVEAEAKEGDILFFASLRLMRLGEQYHRFESEQIAHAQEQARANRQVALEEARRLIERLEARKIAVLIDYPKPLFRAPAFRCADWFNAMNPVCAPGFAIERAFLLTYRHEVVEAIDTLKKRHKNLYVWDPFPLLCPHETCFAFDGDRPLFFDGDHLSAHANRLLENDFAKTLRRIVAQRQELP